MSDDFEQNEPTLVINATTAIERTPQAVEQQVLAVSTDSPLDTLCDAITAADWLLARAKSIHQLSRQIGITWVEANGEFDIGEIHYSVGFNTTVRCTDTIQCGLQLLDGLQGDFGAFLQTLVAQPYKSGSAKRLLDTAAYRRLFVVKPTSRLVAGVPERTLKRIDKRFAF